MSKKDFDMSQLVSGLTGEQEEKNENRPQTLKRKKPMEHVCTLVSVEQMAKVRTIAEREGIALKDIFAVGLNMAIGSYEQKYGEIKVRKAKRGNASEVFGMEDDGMSKRELIDIQTPNKDVVASFIYSWARQKDMSILEQRVVLRIIERASIKLKGIKLRDNMCKLDLGLKNVTITMPASAVLFNTKMKHKDIEQALYNLRGRTFEYKDNERYTVCGFINNATYVYGTGEITVEVDNKIWRVLTDFSEGFRRFELNKALALPTSYSLQFYMVLSGQERPFKLSIGDLKSWLGIAPDKYKKDGKDRVDHIEDRILRPVKKLLDENCPYTFTYDKIRANPNNGKSVAVGFKFYPVYQDKYRDQELEQTRLTALTSVGFMAPRAIDYMRQRMGFPMKSIQPNKDLINNAAKLLPDFIGTLADIQGRRRKADGSYMGIGWVIQAIKGEVEKAEKQPSLFKEWEK